MNSELNSSYNDDVDKYDKSMRFPMIEKAVKSLLGILAGISIDGIINEIELNYLNNWISENGKSTNDKLMRELLQKVTLAIEDGVLESHEIEDIKWFSDNVLNGKAYFNELTSDMQLFHGILAGISSDGKVTETEIRGLQNWIDDNYNLKGSFPFDEMESIIHEVLKDGFIDSTEQQMLISIFSQFQKVMGKASIDPKELHINGVCVMNPEVIFKDKLFCFTGLSIKAKRKDIEKIIVERGGKFKDSVVSNTDFLVIGADGNPCWAFSCYGRKVEQAVHMRKQGRNILLLNEHDFWDSCIK